METYDARVLADSMSPAGVRLTTLVCTFPRFILAEVNTHRVLSRNSASSRAIPPEKQIARVRESPFVPETFNRRIKGMGGGDPLSEAGQAKSRDAWLDAAEHACKRAEDLIALDVDKARVNRLLEPFLWHTAIITSTEWSNFMALRQPENDKPVPQIEFPAQPEFQIIARMMRDSIRSSTPRDIGDGQWHLPLVDEGEVDRPFTTSDGSDDPNRASAEADPVYWAHVSAGRCAKVSYETHENHEDAMASAARSKALSQNGHWSPMEHAARPMTEPDRRDFVLGKKIMAPVRGANLLSCCWCGNIRGWVSLRSLHNNEHDASLLEIGK